MKRKVEKYVKALKKAENENDVVEACRALVEATFHGIYPKNKYTALAFFFHSVEKFFPVITRAELQALVKKKRGVYVTKNGKAVYPHGQFGYLSHYSRMLHQRHFPEVGHYLLANEFSRFSIFLEESYPVVFEGKEITFRLIPRSLVRFLEKVCDYSNDISIGAPDNYGIRLFNTRAREKLVYLPDSDEDLREAVLEELAKEVAKLRRLDQNGSIYINDNCGCGLKWPATELARNIEETIKKLREEHYDATYLFVDYSEFAGLEKIFLEDKIPVRTFKCRAGISLCEATLPVDDKVVYIVKPRWSTLD